MKVALFLVAVIAGTASSANLPKQGEGNKALTCAACKRMAFIMGALAISPYSTSEESVMEAICDKMPAELNCKDNVRCWWTTVSGWMFNPFEGWFAAKHFCEDVCPRVEVANKGEDDTLTCSTCRKRLSGNIAFMKDKNILDKAVSDFNEAKFCEKNYPNMVIKDCQTMLDVLVHTALPVVADSGDDWIPETCQDIIKCKPDNEV